MLVAVVVVRFKLSVLPFWGTALWSAGQKLALFWAAYLASASASTKGFPLWAIDDAVVFAVVVVADAVAAAACSGRRAPHRPDQKPSYFLR